MLSSPLLELSIPLVPLLRPHPDPASNRKKMAGCRTSCTNKQLFCNKSVQQKFAKNYFYLYLNLNNNSSAKKIFFMSPSFIILFFFNFTVHEHHHPPPPQPAYPQATYPLPLLLLLGPIHPHPNQAVTQHPLNPVHILLPLVGTILLHQCKQFII